MRFSDRRDAGRRLGRALAERLRGGVVVVGLPRGGVVVAAAVASALRAPLDVIVVRKLGAPMQPELAIGAVGEGGVRVLDEDLVRRFGISAGQLAELEATERAAVRRRAEVFRGAHRAVQFEGRPVVVVDDGIATGSTARAACQVARAHGAGRVILAAPVAPPEVAARLADVADEVLCLDTPRDFAAIGQFYDDFEQVTDAEVVELLRRAGRPARDEQVTVDAGGRQLAGHLVLPTAAAGLVVFAHGSGSSRLSPRNRFVASVLQDAGHGTLLFDLLTDAEERDRGKVFDIDLLSDRLLEVTDWVRREPGCAGLPIGYFGASTGAAAALTAAADPDAEIAAIVSRGGRPDLASLALDAVRAPTLLIVGGDDDVVVELNRVARGMLRCESRLEIVPGAGHLFEEPGALESVARLAEQWFARHFAGAR